MLFVFYSFLQHALLVFIPSFSMHFLFLSVLQHVLLVFKKQEQQAEERNKNKKYMLKEG
jgi:hypothetical protein